MKPYKAIFTIFSILILGGFTLTSCSNEEEIGVNSINKRIVIDPNVINPENFETLKRQALKKFDKSNFTIIMKPDISNVNYQGIVHELNKHLDEEEINYEAVLGEYYHREYFEQLFNLYEFSLELTSSDLFNINSSINERVEYVEEVLIYVLLYNIESGSTNSGCLNQYDLCKNKAGRDHNIRVGLCTGGAILGAILTGGVGAASWPVCMAGSGLFYQSDITYCYDSYQLCQNN